MYKWDGATLSLIASNSATPEGITNGTAIDLYVSALAIPQTTLAATDRLAIRIYVTHSGRTIKLHTENSHLCQVITTFSTGLTALNGLTAQVQNFATGTSGTDFAISSATSTHTFNLPTASAANRGALSSADWSAFNGKFTLPALTSGSVLFSNGTTIAQDNANLFFDDTNNRLGIGTATPAFGLDVNGTARVSGTTTITPAANTSSITSSTYLVTGSGTTPLLNLNGTVNTSGNVIPYTFDVTNTASGGGSFLVQFKRNGNYILAIGLNDGLIYANNYISASGAWNVSARQNAINGVRFGSIDNSTHTSGNRNHFNLAETFAPTSGTGTYNSIQSNPIINQTGGANGITRGLYINPTLTSAFDFRAIETTVGKVCLNTTSGNTMIGTTTDAGFKLDVNGTARIVGALRADSSLLVNGTSINGSAIAQFDSGTRGLLPPRMTTTQKNAIASPAAGLVVYDTTLGKLCVRGAAAWETITSV